MIIYTYLLISFLLNILCEYSSSKKLLDSNLESSTRVSRVTRHSPNNRLTDPREREHEGWWPKSNIFVVAPRTGGDGRQRLLLAVT